MNTPIVMAFTSVPSESKRAINRAAQEIVNDNYTDDNIDLVERWRACHAYPINTFQSTLRTKLRKYKDPIVAQRLKRFITIIGKLRDDPRLTLTSMQDIGGVRAILKSIRDVYRLRDEYMKSPHFIPMIEPNSCKDYISLPKQSGYRGIHLIFKYKNNLNPSYDGLRIEMQIRTKLQHKWATAVEVMGTFRGEKLKSGRGDQQWQDFFSLVSSYFAYKEKCQPVFSDKSKEETIEAIRTIEREIGAIETMSAFTLAADQIHKSGGKGSSYHLIILDSKAQSVRVQSFDRKSFTKALRRYSVMEEESRKDGNEMEVVLVSAGRLENLKKAYPNYFLDTSEFVAELVLMRDKKV